MAYIVNADITLRVGSARVVELTTESGAVADSTVLDEVRQSAEGEANGYLARRYDVPIDLSAHADLTATLNGFVLDLAVFRLMARRPPISEGDRLMRDNAIEWFKAVSKGEIVLPSGTTPDPTEADDPTSTWGSADATASRDVIV